jgi:hypothetical protein
MESLQEQQQEQEQKKKEEEEQQEEEEVEVGGGGGGEIEILASSQEDSRISILDGGGGGGRGGRTSMSSSIMNSGNRSGGGGGGNIINYNHNHNHNHNHHNHHNNNLVLERYFVDHQSLAVPSSTVRFRGTNDAKANARNSIIANNHHRNKTQPALLAPAGSYVIENEYQQIILEEKIDMKTHQRTIQVKSVQSGNKGLQVLRGVYVIVFFAWVGIFVVFCVQVMLNMVLELP